MDYTQYSFTLNQSEDVSILVAFLQLFEVDSLWEEENIVHAYFQNTSIQTYVGDFEKDLKSKTKNIVNSIQKSIPENINWNEEWESNFSTVTVDDYVFIYADFHSKEAGFQHYIQIAPKMAFGTGHHETTFMMIQQMRSIDFEHKVVLDLGCGTGILSVLTAYEKARKVVAIDIEQPSFENTQEHAKLNQVELDVLCGGVEDVPALQYDVILANINRNVLLKYSNEIKNYLSRGGDLLLSGILEADVDLIKDSYQHLSLKNLSQKGKWMCFHYKKDEIND